MGLGGCNNCNTIEMGDNIAMTTRYFSNKAFDVTFVRVANMLQFVRGIAGRGTSIPRRALSS